MTASRQITISVFLALLALAALSTTAQAQNMQCIFMGTVAIADAPAPWSLEVRLMKADTSLVRVADYNPGTGAYAVSAFQSDGFTDGDGVLFQVALVRDSGDVAEVFIAHASGDVTYTGGFPPAVKTVGLSRNHAPMAFHLLRPHTGDTVQLTTHPSPISFVWAAAVDSDYDALQYTLHVKGPGVDTVIGGIADTSHAVNLIPRMAVSSLYTWWVMAADLSLKVFSADTFRLYTSANILAVKVDREGIPSEFALHQNFPNPFNPSTAIKFQLPSESYVKLVVYSLLGQELAVLVDGKQSAGFKSVEFDASGLPSGVYLYRLSAGSFTQVRKMLLVR